MLAMNPPRYPAIINFLGWEPDSGGKQQYS